MNIDEIPAEVLTKIQKHLMDGCKNAELGWEGGQEEEDALTGYMGGQLETKKWKTVSGGKIGRWRWRLKYAKFGSKGKSAAEKLTGADGIFQLEVEDVKSGEIDGKGLLFQAKKHNNKKHKDLLDQAKKMTELLKNSGAVLIYGPREYVAADAHNAITAEGKLNAIKNKHRLGEYLAKRFLPCPSGARGLYYEATRRTLFIPKNTQGYRRLRARLRHHFRIEVQKLSD